jgi:hypothetical protein
MSRAFLVAALALVTGCYPQSSSEYDTFPEPVTVAGPPGGEMDPAWGVGDPGAYPGGYADGSYDQSIEPSSDPNDPGYVMGTVSDDEINSTLAGKGEWVWQDDYGWVWRPYATEVGVDFTPYETCGSWVWTDWGWTYACDWDWGWLAFHYGRWGWYDDYWAWQPDYEWSPAWVEWRGGGGYVGWRPLGPTIRDHRGQHVGPKVRDHRTGQGPNIRDHRTHHAMDSHWRFTKIADFGKRIRPNLYRAPAEGLRVTSTVTRPPVRASYQPVHVASLMRGRLALRESMANAGSRTPPASSSPGLSGGLQPPGSAHGAHRGNFGGPRSIGGSDPAVWSPAGQQHPTYRPPRASRPATIQTPTYGTPDRTSTPTPPSHPRPAIDDRPSRPDFDRAPPPPGQPTWTPPSRPRPSYGARPSRPDRAPPQPAWTPPSRPRPNIDDRPRPTWTPPARDTSSRSSGSSWSPPSRSSSSSSSSNSSSSSSKSSGNWSPPSRSSSSSSSSSSGSSRSSGSSWGGSRSSGSSGSSGGSRSSGGGGGWGGGARSHRR